MSADYHRQREEELKIEKEPYTSRWFLRWLTCKPAVPDHDGDMDKFQGWEIAPPQMQIPGIQDMLRNQAGSPMLDWKAKIFDCFRYLVSLDMRAQRGEPWYTMLQDALNLIKPNALVILYEKELKQAQLHLPAAVPEGYNRFSHLLRQNHAVPLLTRQRENNTELQDILDPRKVQAILPKFRLNDGKVTDSPLFETGGPWRLAAINKGHIDQEEKRASLTRERAIKTYKEELTTAENDNQPAMPLPDNWNGPVELSLLDEEMKKTRTTLRKHQKLVQQLKAADNRLWDRPLVSEIVQKIDEGQRGVCWREIGMQFGDYEFLPGDTGLELRPIDPEEASWLWYLCRPLHHGRVLPKEDEYEGKYKGFWNRLLAWLGDRNPRERALQTSQRFFPKGEIMRKLNTGLRGPVEKSELEDMESIVWEDTELRSVLRGSQLGDSYAVQQEFLHPENAIRWPEPQQGAGNGGEVDGWEAYLQSLSQAEGQLLTAEQVAEADRNPPPGIRNQERQTSIFFSRIAYRLGYTMRILSRKHRQDLESLESHRKREASQQSLLKALDIWKQTNREEAEATAQAQGGSRKRRRAPSYREIVREHVPDKFLPYWDGDLTSPIEAECAKVVREEIISEFSTNQSAVHVPRKRRRVGAPWTFGHSSMRPRAREFWGIDRWDPHRPPRQQGAAAEGTGSETSESLFYPPPSRVFADGSVAGRAGQRQRAAGDGQGAGGVGERDGQLTGVQRYNRIFNWLSNTVHEGVEQEPNEPILGSEHRAELEPTDRILGNEDRTELEPTDHILGNEDRTESSEQSGKENRGQRTILLSPSASPPNAGGGPLGEDRVLRDVTALHEPGAESEPDLYGVSDTEVGDPRGHDQQEQFEIYEDDNPGRPSSQAVDLGADSPLQDITATHEPGAESESDLYGVSDREDDGEPESQDQQEQFEIFEDASPGGPSNEAVDIGADPLPGNP